MASLGILLSAFVSVGGSLGVFAFALMGVGAFPSREDQDESRTSEKTEVEEVGWDKVGVRKEGEEG